MSVTTATPTLRPRLGAFDPGAVARAEAALKSLSGQFAQWLDDEIAKLVSARAAVDAQGWTAETAEALYFRAHDLKGLGGTYEFPIVSRIAGSLCRLLDGPGRSSAPMALIDDHVDAIRGVVRDGVRDSEHPLGGALASALEGRVAAHLAR